MRHVIKKEEEKTKLLSSSKTYQALCEIVNSGNKDLISDTIYRESYTTSDGKRSKVADQLALSYKHKCAYCERICKVDIEHYRPKKKVTEDETHPGYYWLCYEWTNLLPSCITCNREGAKHNKFPILGKRIKVPPLLPDGKLDLDKCKADSDYLQGEHPYLLHPELDNPEDFFAFEIDPSGEGIRMVGIDTEGRGNKTIEICLLNREELKLDRIERVIDDFKEAIHCLFVQLESHEIDQVKFKNEIIEHIKLLRIPVG